MSFSKTKFLHGAQMMPSHIKVIIICDTYRALPRTHAAKALLPIRLSKKPSLQLHLEGLIVLKWHEMLWQLVPQSCCANRKTPVTISTSVDMQLFAACGMGLPGVRQVSNALPQISWCPTLYNLVSKCSSQTRLSSLNYINFL
jgi:hypothetical protein